MRDFFGLEGPFNKYGGMLADMALVSFMWILFCLPVITAGASTTAMYYVTTRRISEREGYITSDFWLAFKNNFKRATIISLIFGLIMVVVVFNAIELLNNNVDWPEGRMFGIMLPAQIVIFAILGLMSVYVYALLARFDMKLTEIAKSAFFMSIRHFLTSILCVSALVAAIFIFFQLPPLLIVLPGAYAWVSSMLIMRVFRKYRPEMDKDPAQELAEIEAQKAEDRWKRETTIAEDIISESATEPPEEPATE
ncbi:MAG: DUF624 domain-containing protein [Defluviitaleaceae bacterium]|nr:DUF624 domain-containing protein [Defluviitaleaceae bacterium]